MIATRPISHEHKFNPNQGIITVDQTDLLCCQSSSGNNNFAVP